MLDTKGVNVWCAAGEGTFGTEELVSRIASTGLEKIVDHRRLILPQLGATGVSAHLVRQRCGFEVEFGPVRAEDLPQYLKEGRATAQMRRVRFNLSDRLTLVPVELVNSFLPMVLIAGLLFFLGGWFNVLWVLSAWLACTLVFFTLLPWIPAREFSIKGLILGVMIALPFISLSVLTGRWVDTPKPDAGRAHDLDHHCHCLVLHPEPNRHHAHHLLDER